MTRRLSILIACLLALPVWAYHLPGIIPASTGGRVYNPTINGLYAYWSFNTRSNVDTTFVWPIGYAHPEIASEPVLYWLGHESGLNPSSVIEAFSGAVSGAARMDLDQNYDILANTKFIFNSNSAFAGSNFTISLWVKVGAFDNQVFVGQMTNSTGWQIGCTSGGSIRFLRGTGTGTNIHTTLNPISLNTWTHVVCVSSGDYSYIRLSSGSTFTADAEGEAFFQSPYAIPAVLEGSGYLICGSLGFDWEFEIDELFIYARELTTAEQRALFFPQ